MYIYIYVCITTSLSITIIIITTIIIAIICQVGILDVRIANFDRNHGNLLVRVGSFASQVFVHVYVVFV